MPKKKTFNKRAVKRQIAQFLAQSNTLAGGELTLAGAKNARITAEKAVSKAEILVDASQTKKEIRKILIISAGLLAVLILIYFADRSGQALSAVGERLTGSLGI